jgi:hypothetical protein
MKKNRKNKDKPQQAATVSAATTLCYHGSTIQNLFNNSVCYRKVSDELVIMIRKKCEYVRGQIP